VAQKWKVLVNRHFNLQSLGKAPLIYNLFDVNTAHLIHSTPLQPLITNDKLIWKEEKSENYWVHSAYQICVNEIVGNSHPHVPNRWKLIWKLKVPPKVKNITLRVCRGMFSTCARLSSRGVSCLIDCVSCDNNYEDKIHVIVECPKVFQAWCNVNLSDT